MNKKPSIFKSKWAGYTFKIFLPLVVFIIIITFFGQNSLTTQWKKNKKLKANRENIEFLEAEIESMKIELEELRNNNHALEKIVREKYNHKREDEDTYLIIIDSTESTE